MLSTLMTSCSLLGRICGLACPQRAGWIVCCGGGRGWCWCLIVGWRLSRLVAIVGVILIEVGSRMISMVESRRIDVWPLFDAPSCGFVWRIRRTAGLEVVLRC